MSHTSVVEHIPNTFFVAIRQDYLTLVDYIGNQTENLKQFGVAPDRYCTSAILNVFESWTNHKVDNCSQVAYENKVRAEGGLAPLATNGLWIYKSQLDLKENELMDMFGMNKVRDCLNWLVNVKLLRQRKNPQYNWDKTKQYQLNVESINKAFNLLNSPFVNFNDSMLQNQRIDELESTNRSPENNEAIPKITTKITTKKEKNKTSGDVDPIFQYDKPIGPEPFKNKVTQELKECVAKEFYGWYDIGKVTIGNWKLITKMLKFIFAVHDQHGTECTCQHLRRFKNDYLSKNSKLDFTLNANMERNYQTWYMLQKTTRQSALKELPPPAPLTFHSRVPA